MMLFSFRMTLVSYANLNAMKIFPQKTEKILKQTDKYLTENQLTLNADKTEMLFFTNHTNSDPEFSFKGEVIKPAHACRYLGVQMDSNLSFENHLNSVLSKMANAIRSLYLVRYQIPLKVRIDVFKSVVLSHLSFSEVFLQTLTVKNINRINRQINWGIKVCYFCQKFDHSIDLLITDRILPAELFISKDRLMKLQTDIRQWETSKNFKMFSSRHNTTQNKRTNQIILKKKTKTKWSNKSLILKIVQKWNKLPSSKRTFNSKTCFKNVLTEFLLDQHKKVPVNRQIGAFKSCFYL